MAVQHAPEEIDPSSSQSSKKGEGPLSRLHFGSLNTIPFQPKIQPCQSSLTSFGYHQNALDTLSKALMAYTRHFKRVGRRRPTCTMYTKAIKKEGYSLPLGNGGRSSRLVNIPSHKGKPAQVSNRAQGLEADFDSIPLNWTSNPPFGVPGQGELKKKR